MDVRFAARFMQMAYLLRQRPVGLQNEIDRLLNIPPGPLERRALRIPAGQLPDKGDVPLGSLRRFSSV